MQLTLFARSCFLSISQALQYFHFCIYQQNLLLNFLSIELRSEAQKNMLLEENVFVAVLVAISSVFTIASMSTNLWMEVRM